MIARRLLAHGRVQGVGFRDAMVEAARAAQVTGWVRNRLDGSVEAWIQGTDEAVGRVVSWARRGPRLARVSHIELDVAVANPALADFRQIATPD